MEYIADRNISDVETLQEVNQTGWKSLSDDEKTKWFTPSKGAINASDLNRIVNNLIKNDADLEKLAGMDIGGSLIQPKNDWQMRDIPTKAQLHKIVNYYNTLASWCPFDNVDVDLFRFCTVDKLNNFERLIYDMHRMIEEINANGKWKNELTWVLNDTENYYFTDKKKMGSLAIQIVLPIGSTLVVNKYIPNGTLNQTIKHSAYTEADRILEIEGSSYLLYEFMCTRQGAEIYTLGKVGI